jgi:hypothetical protein
MMELNPCLSCSGKDQNKNNPICIHCEKRLEYVNQLEMKLNYTFSYGESGPTAGLVPMSLLSKGASLE